MKSKQQTCQRDTGFCSTAAGPEQRPLVIPIFIPHSGCPHQCAFCNQTLITNEKHPLPDRESIADQAAKYLGFRGKRKKVQLAFFGGTFLGLEKKQVQALLESGQRLVDRGLIDSMRFSTRPDTITKETLDFLAPYSVETIELGAQSMDDRVLGRSKRGHTALCTREAAGLLNEYRYETGLQLMTGLPGENRTTALASATAAAALLPDFVRIYPLTILNKSLIHRWFAEKSFTPLSLDDCVTRVKELFLIFAEKKIPVIRMGLQASEVLEGEEAIVAGPWHPAFGHLVFSEIFLDKTLELLEKRASTLTGDSVTVWVNPVSLSRLRGDKNRNVKTIKRIYPGLRLHIKTDRELAPEQITITAHRSGF
ncbi:MAG: radical SAM protein [Desulfobacteraceae bacterium]